MLYFQYKFIRYVNKLSNEISMEICTSIEKPRSFLREIQDILLYIYMIIVNQMQLGQLGEISLSSPFGFNFNISHVELIMIISLYQSQALLHKSPSRIETCIFIFLRLKLCVCVCVCVPCINSILSMKSVTYHTYLISNSNNSANMEIHGWMIHLLSI